MATAQGQQAGGFDLKNIKLTKEQQNVLVVAVLLIAGTAYLYINYLFQPNVKKIQERTAVLQQKKKDLQDARQMAGSYSEFVKKAEFINRKVDFANRRLPLQVTISDTIREITIKATEANIGIISFQPLSSLKKNGYTETKVNVNFETNYYNLGKFLTNIGYIESMTAASGLRINSIIQKDSVSADTIRVDMELKVYSYLEGGK